MGEGEVDRGTLRWFSLLAVLSLVSLVLQGPQAAATPASSGGLLNLAAASRGATVWATSSAASHEPGRAIDGATETAWWATASGSFYVDFPGERVLREVHVHLQADAMPRVELALRDGAGGYRIVQSWSGATGLDPVFAAKGGIATFGLRIDFPEPLSHTHRYIHPHCSSGTPVGRGLANGLLGYCYDHLHSTEETHYARVSEVEAWGALQDADGDGLADDEEAAGWEVAVTRLGATDRYWVTSDPLQADADEDGLADPEERAKRTDPGLWDTDEDGLWDDEDPGPLRDDRDGDGVPDGLDRVPEGRASLAFRTRFPPGLVRYRQPFSVFSVEGRYAWVHEYNHLYGTCQFRSDETRAATRSSVVDGGKVLAEVQRTFDEGGERDYAPTRAVRLYEQGTAYHDYTYGGCDFWSPKQYKIGYGVPEDKWAVDFVNMREVAVPDGFGGQFQFALERIPVRRGHPISLVLQYTLPVTSDRTAYVDSTTYRMGAMGYTVYGAAPGSEDPLFANAALAAGLTEGAYQLQLRIPGSVTAQAPADPMGVPFLQILMLPFWLDVKPYAVDRLSWDVSRVTWAALSLEVPIFVHQVIARLSVDVEDLETALPRDLERLAPGFHTFSPYRVFLYRASASTAFDPGILGQVDAVLLLGISDADVIVARDAIDWGPPGSWYEEGADAFNSGLKWFQTGTRLGGLSLHFLDFRNLANVLLNGKAEFPGIPVNPGERDVTITVQKAYVSGKVMFIQTRWVSVDASVTVNGLRQVWEVRRHLEVGRYEQIEDVPALKGRYTTMRAALRGAAIGAILVTWGRTGVLAFLDGDVVKGSVYTAATSTTVFGSAYSGVPLSRLGIKSFLGKIPASHVGVLAVGAIFASYNLFVATQSTDPISQLSHLEQASAWTVDTSILLASPYGQVVVLTWAVTVAIMSIAMPSSIAVSVTSSPGAFVTFAFEYVFTGGIPSAVSRDALDSTASWAISQMRQWNSVFQIPSIVVLPES